MNSFKDVVIVVVYFAVILSMLYIGALFVLNL